VTGRKVHAAPGAGRDGRPRTVDRWKEAGREDAMLDVLALVLAGRASGLDDGEIVNEVEAVTLGAAVVAAADFPPKDWTP
jgi:hypothetical protein